MHNWYIGSFSRQKRQQHGHCPSLRMSVNGETTMFPFASAVIYVPIGWRHPFVRYWQPLLGKTRATCSLPHPEIECQRCINDFQLRILGNLCSDRLQTFIYQIVVAFIGKTTATWSLPHSENDRQRSINSLSCCIFGNQGIAQIFTFTIALLTAVIDKNTIYRR